MQPISSNDEMTLIKLERKGFILNERPEGRKGRKVHHVTCEAVTVMHGTAHPKYFSENRVAAKEWLDQRFGTDGWVNCGSCSGLRSPLAD